MKYWIIAKNDKKSTLAKEKLMKNITLELDEKNPELVVAIGGDGTFINAVHQFPQAVIFGLHTGHLGFYSNYTLESLDDLIMDINEKKYKVEWIDLLKCSIQAGKKNIVDYALNEMTIIMPPRTLILNVYVDEEKFETFRGTGLCISTSYGSTAYNKSLHGAVVDPSVKAFQMTEIAGINSNSYRTLSSSLLLASHRTIILEALQEGEVYITIDNISYNIKEFSSAQISVASDKIQVAYHELPHFVERIKRTFLTQ